VTALLVQRLEGPGEGFLPGGKVLPALIPRNAQVAESSVENVDLVLESLAPLIRPFPQFGGQVFVPVQEGLQVFANFRMGLDRLSDPQPFHSHLAYLAIAAEVVHQSAVPPLEHAHSRLEVVAHAHLQLASRFVD